MEGKKIALEKMWNLLILLIVGEVSTAFHYRYEKAGWLIICAGVILLLVLVVASLTNHLDREKET
jgi:hypothetical protein